MRDITIRLNEHELKLLETVVVRNKYISCEEAVRSAVHFLLIHETNEDGDGVTNPEVRLSPAILREAIVETLGESEARPLDFDAMITDLNIKAKVA